ncbi:MAG: sulfate ABC transporter permease subunit CysT [Candidatus Zixiibacteriota bacterium]|nr:MAG: sulfate ABC transporter permease subunit CysT [candidate division Zixibacteria bacterium]
MKVQGGSVLGSGALLKTATFSYVGLLVILPLLAISISALGQGLGSIVADVTQPQAWFALKLTFACAFAMALINAVTGLAMAWVLVRYDFPGKPVINSLIDLPFALPTNVTGLMLVVLYGPVSAIGQFLKAHGIEIIYAQAGIVLALLFVTFPFVVRAVQPVLMELDKDIEEAAATLGAGRFRTFRKVVLPHLLPSVLTGVALAFSRALGEFGSVVVVAGNIPLKTQVAPVFIYGEIESYNPRGALAVSLVLLLSSLAILILLNVLQRWGRERGT